MHGLCVSAADSTLDSGMGSTVYSDSHSSQQSVLYQSLLEPITIATQQVCIRSIHTQVDHVHLDVFKCTHSLKAAIADVALEENTGSVYSSALVSTHTHISSCIDQSSLTLSSTLHASKYFSYIHVSLQPSLFVLILFFFLIMIL